MSFPPVTGAPRSGPMWRLRLVRRGQRIAMLALLLLGLSFGGIFLTNALIPLVHASPSRYGPDPAKVRAAVQAAAWPQQQHVWCGVAAVAAVADFRGAGVSQAAVAGALNSASGQSEWGVPGPSGDSWGPGFQADIARDGGTDPRAHAAGLALVTHAGYHEAVDYTGPWTATSRLVNDLLRAQEPIVAIVDHGAHTVLVAGVYASGDPSNLNDVTGLEVWDPGVNSVDIGVQAAQEEVVSLNSWLYGWGYWGGTYNANWSDGRMLDPDPAIGPYTYDPSGGRDQHLWIGHYVYIRPDASGEATNGVSPDWAFNQNVALIRGFSGEVPSGYNGPSVALYVPPPPTPTPLPTATPTPTPTPAPTWTPHKPPIDPTLSWENETVTPSTPTVVAQRTPVASAPLSFSLQQVCFGANCTPGAPWFLGSGFLLAAVLLMVSGLILLRRRSRTIVPALATPAVTPVAFQTDESQPPQEAEVAQSPVAGVGTAQAEGVRDDEGGQVQGAQAGDADEPTIGPLARLAGAASRLDGLAEGAPEYTAPPVEAVTEAEAPPTEAVSETEASPAETAPQEEPRADDSTEDLTLAALAEEVVAQAAQTAPQAEAPAEHTDSDAEAIPASAIVVAEGEQTNQ